MDDSENFILCAEFVGFQDLGPQMQFSSTTGAALLEGGVEGYQRSPFGTPESRCGSRLLILNDSEDGFGWS